MRVWIVNPFDNLPLEGTRPQRYWLMARAFARAGHDVVLWTSDFSHARKAKRALDAERCVSRPDGSLLCGGFRLVLVPTPGYPRNICLRRIWSHRAFARRWRARAEAEAAPDVLVVSLPPLALGAQAHAYAAAHPGVRFVADVQDAWPETFEQVAPRWTLAPLRRVAGRIYRGADAISGVAERYVELARSYGATAPMAVFPLGIEMPARFMRTGDRCAPEREELRAGGRCATQVRGTDGRTVRLVYAGMMGTSYDLGTLVDVVKGDGALSLDLAGAGPGEVRLRARAGDCPRIRFRGYLGETALRDFLSDGDAGVVPTYDASCVGVPGKLADYLAAGLPVLNALHGETERLLAEHGAGFTYRAGDADSLRDAVARLRAADRTALRAGAARLAARFDADRVYGGYVDWIVARAVTGH
ncbi:MAG: glycosyltransferase [Kiritimatiellae bacterium]|nr:glycosyltransferase [Kiritimatiellia bacterium]